MTSLKRRKQSAKKNNDRQLTPPLWMSDETSTAIDSTPWQRLAFELVGWVYCLVTGNSWKYNVLLAQANLEARDLRSGIMMRARNPWGMHAPTPYSTGSIATTDGMLATFGSWWTCWKARIEWDSRHGVGETATLADYVKAVCAAGYNTRPLYPDAWMSKYAQLGWWTTLFDPPEDSSTWWSKLKATVVSVVLVGLTMTLLVWIWRKWGKSWKGKAKRLIP